MLFLVLANDNPCLCLSVYLGFPFHSSIRCKETYKHTPDHTQHLHIYRRSDIGRIHTPSDELEMYYYIQLNKNICGDFNTEIL